MTQCRTEGIRGKEGTRAEYLKRGASDQNEGIPKGGYPTQGADGVLMTRPVELDGGIRE